MTKGHIIAIADLTVSDSVSAIQADTEGTTGDLGQDLRNLWYKDSGCKQLLLTYLAQVQLVYRGQ